MKRIISRILTLLCALLLIIFPLPAIAEETSAPPSFTEKQIQEGEKMAQKALEASKKGDFSRAEIYWSQLIEQFPTNPAIWSNRGNIRISQNKIDEAIADYNQAIKLAPDVADAYVNRGIAFEQEKLFEEAIVDYNKAIEINPEDAVAYNNRGNAKAGLNSWQEALEDYQKASAIAPNFAFARANTALALYQTGKIEEGLKCMRNIVRKYPMFADMRAALTAVLWQVGQQGEAESNWVAAVGLDSRYQDLDWVKTIRRWPPKMVTALEKFLTLN